MTRKYFVLKDEKRGFLKYPGNRFTKVLKEAYKLENAIDFWNSVEEMFGLIDGRQVFVYQVTESVGDKLEIIFSTKLTKNDEVMVG